MSSSVLFRLLLGLCLVVPVSYTIGALTQGTQLELLGLFVIVLMSCGLSWILFGGLWS